MVAQGRGHGRGDGNGARREGSEAPAQMRDVFGVTNEEGEESGCILLEIVTL